MRALQSGQILLALCFIAVEICAITAIEPQSTIVTGNRQHHERNILQKDQVQLMLKAYLQNMPMQDHLKEFATRCGFISRLKSIGKSTNGFNIWALEISNKPGRAEPKPHVKLVGNLHGDEPTGRVFTMALAEWLCKHYEIDERAKNIVDNIHLWLLPSMNPDGFAAKTRENAHGIDLNRSFPDRFNNSDMEPTNSGEAETAVMMKWSLSQHFVSSLAFHEGSLVANYPFDGTADHSTRYEASPDDITFKYLANTYAKNHLRMSLSSNKEFPKGGITNGAAWYPIYGSMQDWNYLRAGCMELTIESSYDKWPNESSLAGLFKDNLPAMLEFIKVSALGGVRGRVLVETGGLRKDKGKEMQPVEANITIEGSDFIVKSSSVFGDYYRPLAPGKYTVVVRREGYPTARSNITVPTDGTGVVRDFVLRKKLVNSPNGLVITAEMQRKHGVVLLLCGFGILWGLWIVHKKMTQRTGLIARQRSA